MRKLRLAILFTILLGALFALHYFRTRPVHTETIQFRSNLLGKTLPYVAVLPPKYSFVSAINKRYPVLYLLHGWSGHYDSWQKNTGLVQYAADHQLIIITPEGNNGWYTDSATNATDKYETYILQELIPDVDSRFRTIADRQGRGIGGFSMGGYGALKFGFKHPDLFSFVASMSGALDAPIRMDDESILQTFGDATSSPRRDNDVLALAANVPVEQIKQLPYIYFDCGRDDPWLRVNQRFAEILRTHNVRFEFHEVPGNHTWTYWDQRLPQILGTASARMSSKN
jgi:S-formylglutathione hydrolase FrmB